MAKAPTPGGQQRGWNTIAPNFRFRITLNDGTVHEVRTLPIDHHTVARAGYGGLNNKELSSAYPFAWACARREGWGDHNYETWLARVADIEFFDERIIDPVDDDEDDPKGLPLDESLDSSPTPE